LSPFHVDTSLGDWFNAFHKDCPCGYLTSKDFQTIYAQYFPNGDSSEFAKHMFRAFDTEKNQRVTFAMFLYSLNITTRAEPRDKIQWAFRLYDVDGDGFISYDDMFAVVRVRRDLCRRDEMLPLMFFSRSTP
jgi:Ca2+-binding EF-hand superfamily protein